MTTQEAYQKLLLTLYTIYDTKESANIASWVMENVTHFSKLDRIMNKEIVLTDQQQQQLQDYTEKLLRHIPVQYILSEAWFYNFKLYVNEQVLIPRPETEELVEWVVSSYPQKKINEPMHIIDVGTGSGCIAITLKKQIPAATITAIDISAEALAVAKQNAATLLSSIHFQQLDFLDTATWTTLPTPDILISNPPYIPLKEKASISKHVKDYEPATALFVPDNNPLIFYKALAQFALKYMQPKSFLFAEVHANYGREVYALWTTMGLKAVLKKDMQGKNRMIKGQV